MQAKLDRRYVQLWAVVAGALALAAWLGPVPQDPAYHLFADCRSCGGIPNCFNVLSSVPFLIVGSIGLYRLRLWPEALRPAWRVFWLGVFGTGLGSAWYHLSPDDGRLVWDRLPMTLAFAGFFAAVLIDQFRFGQWVLWSMVALGLTSIGIWQVLGDLRLYGLVQFLPPVLVVLIFARFPPGRIRRRPVYQALVSYALAKVAELLDREIFLITSWLSGHTLKHLLAALAVAWLVNGFQNTRLLSHQ